MAIRPDIVVRLYSDEERRTQPSRSIPASVSSNPNSALETGGVGWNCIMKIYSCPLRWGRKLEILINDTLCFQGWIAQRRLDSIDDHLSLFAVRGTRTNLRCYNRRPVRRDDNDWNF